MKLFIMVHLSLVALIFLPGALAQGSRSYRIDSQECLSRLQWNIDFTGAKCKVRNGTLEDGQGYQSVNFSLPVSTAEGWRPMVKVGIRPLRNGYVLRLKAEEPVSPEKIGPLLAWALKVSAPEGIERPEGLCSRFLSEVKGLF